MSWIKSERIQFINEFERKYGVRLSENDEMLPILHFIFDAGNSTSKRLEDSQKIISKVETMVNTALIKINPIVYDIKQGDAINWQIGIALRVLFYAFTGALISFVVYYFSDQYLTVRKAKEIIQTENDLRNLQIKIDKNGYSYLEFQKPEKKGSILFYKEYEMLEDKSIRVYLRNNNK